MIITTNNNTITVGPAWPCCYEYPTANANYNSYNNVSVSEIKRRFYNSIKKAEVTVGSISYTVNFGNANLIADIASIFNNLSINLFGQDWFHADIASSSNFLRGI